jgi:hypothetical protein
VQASTFFLPAVTSTAHNPSVSPEKSSPRIPDAVFSDTSPLLGDTVIVFMAAGSLPALGTVNVAGTELRR